MNTILALRIVAIVIIVIMICANYKALEQAEPLKEPVNGEEE